MSTDICYGLLRNRYMQVVVSTQVSIHRIIKPRNFFGNNIIRAHYGVGECRRTVSHAHLMAMLLSL